MLVLILLVRLLSPCWILASASICGVALFTPSAPEPVARYGISPSLFRILSMFPWRRMPTLVGVGVGEHESRHRRDDPESRLVQSCILVNE
jgi:hypothetical protein